MKFCRACNGVDGYICGCTRTCGPDCWFVDPFPVSEITVQQLIDGCGDREDTNYKERRQATDELLRRRTLTQKEIARRTGASVRTVERRSSKLRREIREAERLQSV